MHIKADFIHKSEIKKYAYSFLDEFYPEKTIPIPIDLIAEKRGIDIVPLPGLCSDYEIDAFISKDLLTISVDQHIMMNVDTRYRFSVAHELGHSVLHKKYYSEFHPQNPNEWKRFYCDLKKQDHNYLEYQAYAFASYVLIPDYDLIDRFSGTLEEVLPRIEKAKAGGLQKKDYLEYVIDTIATDIARPYNVSQQAMCKRLSQDNIYIDKIP